jgi:molecular chaperone GrpE
MSETTRPPADEPERANETGETGGAEVPIERPASPADEAGGTAGAPSAEDRLRDLEDRLRRSQADFVNESKRIQRQADDRVRYATNALVVDLLPVFDALHSAREGFSSLAAGDDTAKGALEGFDLVEKELMNVLSRHGVARIEAEPAGSFDPAVHHAIVMVDVPELPPGTVARELRPGFQLHERVVRPAHVAVVAERAREGADDAEQNDAPDRGA